ncbi:hypothetical protein CBR_g61877 [Chara braunii]|uniref:Uncharacterized protein n=1 Tax=Chara braunii TaxID=69332 RepID=A0A388MFB7_CHABU|nr:hypothetical protein CBR_g61877 [Chara braunii]|eukprot:GBG93250.1 hypothetical protein CBR_g61877 [Chara braunii]
MVEMEVDEDCTGRSGGNPLEEDEGDGLILCLLQRLSEQESVGGMVKALNALSSVSLETRVKHNNKVLQALIECWATCNARVNGVSIEEELGLRDSILRNASFKVLEFAAELGAHQLYARLGEEVCLWSANAITEYVDGRSGGALEAYCQVQRSVVNFVAAIICCATQLYGDGKGEVVGYIEPVIPATFKLARNILFPSEACRVSYPADFPKLAQGLVGAAVKLVLAVRQAIRSCVNVSAPDNAARSMDGGSSGLGNGQEEGGQGLGGRGAGAPLRGKLEAISSCSLPDVRVVATTCYALFEMATASSRQKSLNFAIANLTWKGLVSLLQDREGRAVIAQVVDIPEIINTLISLMVEAFQTALRAWIAENQQAKADSGNPDDQQQQRKQACGGPTEKDLERSKKRCIPIKFFLLNLMRICCTYPSEAMSGTSGKEIISYVVQVSAVILVQPAAGHCLLPSAAVLALTELVGPILFGLLRAMLTCNGVAADAKVTLIRYLCDSEDDEPSLALASLHSLSSLPSSFDDAILSSKGENRQRPPNEVILSGRLATMVVVMQCAAEFEMGVLMELVRKLDWVLECVQRTMVFNLTMSKSSLPQEGEQGRGPKSSTGPVPVKSASEVPLYSRLVNAVAVLAAVIGSSEDADSASTMESGGSSFGELPAQLECFLFANAMHPNPLCADLVLRVWCFILQHSSDDGSRAQIQLLISLLRECILGLDFHTVGFNAMDSVHTIARLIVALLQSVSESVTNSILDDLLLVVDPSLLAKPEFIASLAVLLSWGLNVNEFRNSSGESFASIVLKKYGTLSLQIARSIASAMTAGIMDIATLHSTLCCMSFLLIGNRTEDLAAEREIACEIAIEVLKAAARDDLRPRTVLSLLLPPALQVLKLSWSSLTQDRALSVLHCLLAAAHRLGPVKHGPKAAEMAFHAVLAEFLAVLSTGCDTFDTEMWGVVHRLFHVALRETHSALVFSGLVSFEKFGSNLSMDDLWKFVPPDAAAGRMLIADVGMDVSHTKPSGPKDFPPTQVAFMKALGQVIEDRESGIIVRNDEEDFDLMRRETDVLCALPRSQSTALSMQLGIPDPAFQERSGITAVDGRDLSGAAAEEKVREGFTLVRSGLNLLEQALPSLRKRGNDPAVSWEWISSSLDELRLIVDMKVFQNSSSTGTGKSSLDMDEG